jgi:O-antigen ligase
MIKKIRFRFFDAYLLIFLLPLVINPWGFTYYEAPKIFFLRVFVSLFLLGGMAYFLKTGKSSVHFGKVSGAMIGVWFLSLLLSTVFSIAPLLSFWGSYERVQGLLSHVFYLLHFIILYQYFRSDEERKKVLGMIFIVSVAVAVYGILQKFGIYLFRLEENPSFLGRIFSTLGQPNFLGQYLLFPIWIGILWLKNANGLRKKVIAAIPLFIMVGAFLLTENRASLFGLAVSLGLYLALMENRLKKLRWVLLAVLTAACVGFIVFVAPNTRSLNSRFLIWQTVPKIAAGHLLLGSGPETFSLTFPRYYPTGLYQYEAIKDNPDRAHDEPLDILLNQGMVGLAVYLAAIFAIIFAALKKRDVFRSPVFAIAFFALTATIISDIFAFQLTSHYLLFFTMLAILASYLEKPVKVEIRRNVFAVFMAGILAAILILNIWQSGKYLAADMVFGRGIDELAANKTSEAFKSFASANELNPDQGYLAFLTGHFYADMGNASGIGEIFAYSRDYLDRFAVFSGSNYEYYMETARVEAYEKKYAEMEKNYNLALEYAPHNPIIWLEWSMRLYETQKYTEAIDRLEKYFSLIPDYWQWGPVIGEKNAEEKETYRIFMKTNADVSVALEIISDSLVKTGDSQKAAFYKQYMQ